MILCALTLTILTLLWAALGFQGLGKRTGAVVQTGFVAILFVSASAYGVAQAMVP